MNGYQGLIKDVLTELGHDQNPVHVEAFMRSAHGELDGLYLEDFKLAVALAAEAVKQEPKLGQELAESFGLERSGK